MNLAEISEDLPGWGGNQISSEQGMDNIMPDLLRLARLARKLQQHRRWLAPRVPEKTKASADIILYIAEEIKPPIYI